MLTGLDVSKTAHDDITAEDFPTDVATGDIPDAADAADAVADVVPAEVVTTLPPLTFSKDDKADPSALGLKMTIWFKSCLSKPLRLGSKLI